MNKQNTDHSRIWIVVMFLQAFLNKLVMHTSHLSQFPLLLDLKIGTKILKTLLISSFKKISRKPFWCIYVDFRDVEE